MVMKIIIKLLPTQKVVFFHNFNYCLLIPPVFHPVATDLTCDFDDQFMCGYTHTTTVPGAKPWKRLSSGFTTYNGPVTDHTKGDGTGKIADVFFLC